jgi:hypothetical protein
MEATTFQISSSAGFSSPAGREERDREPSELSGRNKAVKDFFLERAIFQ